MIAHSKHFPAPIVSDEAIARIRQLRAKGDEDCVRVFTLGYISGMVEQAPELAKLARLALDQEGQ